MVVQKSWNTNEASPQNAVSESSNTTWGFQVPRTVTVRTTATGNMQAKQPITRQIAINTLAAMQRRFSLPGPMQPHSRPIAEFRASANKSLDILRQTIQSAVTKEIDQVIKKYLEKFFVPAVNNIRMNLGDESVSEDQVRAVCRAMLDAARLLYTTPQKPAQVSDNNDSETGDSDSKFAVKQINLSPQNKRKDTENEPDFGIKRKKVKDDSSDSGTSSPVPALRDPEKWNPARLTQDTLFIMGSHAHKVLGLGAARGRLYTRHAGLPRYPADAADKDWISSHNLVNAVAGKTYIMVLEDIEELAKSETYKHSSLPMLGELTGFKVPMFMLRKIKAYVLKKSLSGDLGNADSPVPSTSSTQDDDKYKLENIKIEQDTFDTNNFNASQYNLGPSDNTKDFSDVPTMKEDTDTDLADIKVEDMGLKVDGVKVEDLDEIKVEAIKDVDFEVDVKVENMDDINLEGDEFALCKQTDEEGNLVDGLLDADIEFLSRNLGNIESDADARKTIEKLTGANPDTLTLVGDEFDLGATLNTNTFPSKEPKCITVASSRSGVVHSVPVTQLPSAIYYSPRASPLPQATLTIQSVPAAQSQLIRGIPITTKTGTFSTVMSQGTASTIIGFGARTSNSTIIGTPTQYVVSSKSFPTGNILHNAIVSRNIINRNLTSFNTSSKSQKISTVSVNTDFDSISTTKDMIDNACSSSVMLKKVLTLGGSGTKSFMMHNTQKVLSTGFAKGATPPPNVTIVSSTAVGKLNNVGHSSANIVNTSGTLSATHATLSALLSSVENASPGKK